jgi:uncharacterized protein YjiK
MRNRALGAVLAAALLGAAACGCPSIRFPYLWPGTPGFGGDIDAQKIPEPSGICFDPARRVLFVVSDEGWLYEITREGAPISHWRLPGDLEAVTLDPQTGLLYVVIEGEDVILEFDRDRGEISRRFPINRSFRGDPDFLQKQTRAYDNGVECLVFVPDGNSPEGGVFYAGNQWDPPMMMELAVPIRTSWAPEAEARIVRVLPCRIDDPAGVYYDPRTRLLNVVSDADNILYEVTLQGRIVRRFAFPGNDQEGLARDDQGYLYIAQDSGGIIKIKDLRRTP